MNTLKDYISEYLNYCEYRKQLNFKTIKAYKIDLNQYNSFCLDISDPFSKKAVDSILQNCSNITNPNPSNVKLPV